MNAQLDEEQAVFGDQPLDVQTDSAVPGRVFATLIGGFLFVLLLGILLSRWWVLQTLDEFEVGLPAASVVALNPAFPAVVGVLLMLTIAKQFLIRSPRAAVAGNTIALLAGLLLLAIYLVGAISPFLLLVDGLF
jgi:hypothetical protein